MSTNQVNDGKYLPFTAPTGGAVSGVPLLIGAAFVVPMITAAEGEMFEATQYGLWILPKTAANTPAEGVKAYWDNTAKAVTTTATSNTLIGIFAEAGTNGQTSIKVKLNGVVL